MLGGFYCITLQCEKKAKGHLATKKTPTEKKEDKINKGKEAT